MGTGDFFFLAVMNYSREIRMTPHIDTTKKIVQNLDHSTVKEVVSSENTGGMGLGEAVYV